MNDTIKLVIPVSRLLGDERAGANRLAKICVELHVRSCGYPPLCVRRIASGHLTTQFQRNPSSRSRNAEKGCARAPVPQQNKVSLPFIGGIFVTHSISEGNRVILTGKIA